MESILRGLEAGLYVAEQAQRTECSSFCFLVMIMESQTGR